MTEIPDKVTIQIPSGDPCYYTYEEGSTYCSVCDESQDAASWEFCYVFVPEKLAEHIKYHNLAVRVDGEQDIADLFDSVDKVVMATCPNGCQFLGEEGDSWWHISETQYICDGCNEWYSSSHEAMLCCGDHGTDEDVCLNMVAAEPNGQPTLIDGLPYSRCVCGGGSCNLFICLVCHYTSQDQYTVKSHARDHAGQWELVEPVVYPPTGYHIDGGQNTIILGNTFTPRPNTTNTVVYYGGGLMTAEQKHDCVICGNYCCKIHQTHIDPHGMCWL